MITIFIIVIITIIFHHDVPTSVGRLSLFHVIISHYFINKLCLLFANVTDEK